MSGDAKARVLVVDDDRLFREILSESLRGEGYEVESAADGEAALKMICRQPFDAMVTDLEMPRMRGEDLAAAVKADWPGTVVIAVAVEPATPRVRMLVEAGCEGLLSKASLDVTEVVKAIEAGRKRQKHIRSSAQQTLLDEARRELVEGLAPTAESLAEQLEQLLSDAPESKSRAHLTTRSLVMARQLRDALRQLRSEAPVAPKHNARKAGHEPVSDGVTASEN